MIIDLVGGYDSTGFWILIFSLLFVGSILSAFGNLLVKITGLGLFVLGCVELVGYINFTIENAPNLPEYANIVTTLFAIIVILIVFKMSYSLTIPKGKSKNEVDKP